MQYQEKFYRGSTLGTETCSLSADIYNDMRQLISRHDGPQVFVPVRSLQYMAVISEKEVQFVDIHIQRVTELSWSGFQAGARSRLDSSVPYSCAWHNSKAENQRHKAPKALAESLKTLLNKMRDKEKSQKTTVLKFPVAS